MEGQKCGTWERSGDRIGVAAGLQTWEHDATGRIAIGSDTCTACRYGITWIYRKLVRFKITIPWFIKLYFTRKKAEMIYLVGPFLT
jgi:hypothetical protein